MGETPRKLYSPREILAKIKEPINIHREPRITVEVTQNHAIRIAALLFEEIPEEKLALHFNESTGRLVIVPEHKEFRGVIERLIRIYTTGMGLFTDQLFAPDERRERTFYK